MLTHLKNLFCKRHVLTVLLRKKEEVVRGECHIQKRDVRTRFHLKLNDSNIYIENSSQLIILSWFDVQKN